MNLQRPMDPFELVSTAGSEYVWLDCLEGWQKDPEKRPAAALIDQAMTLIRKEHTGAWGKAALKRLKQIEPPPERDEIHDIIGYDE